MTNKRQSLTELIKETVDRVTVTVERVHKAVADLPLRVMEETGLLQRPAKEVRRLQDQTIGAIYDLVRDTNRRVARLVSELLGDSSRAAEKRAA